MNRLSVFESHRSVSSKFYRYRPETNANFLITSNTSSIRDTISNRRIINVPLNSNDSNKVFAICDRSLSYIFEKNVDFGLRSIVFDYRRRKFATL